jgi:hypothetical protein
LVGLLWVISAGLLSAVVRTIISVDAITAYVVGLVATPLIIVGTYGLGTLAWALYGHLEGSL